MNQKYLESAMLFARLYGIAETLNPWSYIDNETFIGMIKEWTKEFICIENGDVLKFFEWKISQKKTSYAEYIKNQPPCP